MRYLIFCLLFRLSGVGHAQNWTALPDMPEPVTNNATTLVRQSDGDWIYSFAGLDSTLSRTGIHLKSWRLRIGATAWQALPPVPDPDGGKIAAAASTVKDRIYVIGGYHVAANGQETSSGRVHRFDTHTGAWLTDGAPIPKAVDDQVQAVWRDSLIFVVTGWSNTTNVPDVQIYDPASDSWTGGTWVPNQTNFKVFGASGIIIGDTLYYAGGARTGPNFPATAFFRKGYIHPDNPAQIDWSGYTAPQAEGYRMACARLAAQPVWLGGAEVTYNYDGLAYDGSGIVPALDRITLYRPDSGTLEQRFGKMPALMDLRGAGQLSETTVVLAGGIGPGRIVSAQTWLLDLKDLTVATSSVPVGGPMPIFPNPATDQFTVAVPGSAVLCIYDTQGRLLQQLSGLSGRVEVSVSNLAGGVYFLSVTDDKGNRQTQKIVVRP